MKKNYFLFLLILTISYSASAQLIINEVLYDPPAGAAGDANGDGTRDATDDGFIEFVNTGATSLDVSGYMIYDNVIADGTRTLRHTIPSGTILPANGFLVVFGGGTPTGAFGGATVIADTGSAGLSLQNSGEIIEIENASGTVILTFDSDALSNNPDESYTRNPDITGDFVQHKDAVAGVLFSPGTFADGSVLSNEEFSKLELSIYPNPVTQNQINIKTPTQGLKTIALYDMNGRKMLEEETNGDVMDVSKIKRGLYLLELNIDNKTQTSKIIIK
ncbi:lamin tail domain-containing protein [Tenacibaculum adriaticum]|nr:lamin tail domain-containing protein [Tenacibaculum adriaticum]